MWLMRLRVFNPFRMLGNVLQLYRIRGFFNRFKMMSRQFLRVPNFIKQPLQRFGLFKDKKKSKKGKSDSENLSEGDERNYVYYRQSRRRRMSEVAECSQIHLIHQTSGQRTVVHIGTSTGEVVSEILLDYVGHSPVKLQFRQVNPQDHSSQIVIRHSAGQADVIVDQQAILFNEIPVQDKSVITIDGEVYHCELYAWDGSILPPATRVLAGWNTDVGPRRKHNEDAIGIYQHQDAYMFVIADGVGGSEAGELISEFAVQYMLAVFHRNVPYRLSWHEIFALAMDKINEEVWYFTQRAGIGRAGTTLTVGVIKQWDLHLAHVGDSRIYHLGRRGMKQVTAEHIREMNDEDTRYEPNQETQMILTKAIGKEETVTPQIKTVRLQPGDKLLLCTDGLTDNVSADEIQRYMMQFRPQQVADGLVTLANDRDNTDNVSVMAIDILPHTQDFDAWRVRKDERVYAGYTSVYPLRKKIDLEFLTRYEVVTPKRVINLIFAVVMISIIIYLLPLI